MPCDYPHDRYGCVSFQDFKKSLDAGCMAKCFTLASYEPEKVALEQQRNSKKVKTPEAIKAAPPELELAAPTTPSVVQPSVSVTEATKPPINDSNPLLGAFLIAAVSSVGIPMLKDWAKSKLQKKKDDSVLECKPAQIRTNGQIKELVARIDKLENKISVNAGDDIEEIKNRLDKLESRT